MLTLIMKEDYDSEDEEVEAQLNKIEEKVLKKLSKHREVISEKDMKRLLSEARKQQEEIIRQRNIQKVKQNEKMRLQLQERRKAKVRFFNGSVVF